MYLPRSLISHLYNHLVRSQHPLSPPVLILVALETDALCACRILTSLLKRDYVPHKIHPISGYGDLAHAANELVQPMKTSNGGSGGIVVCLGVGGLVDLAEALGLESEDPEEDALGGVEVWVLDSRRPWNLGNVFGGSPANLPLGDLDGNARPKTKGVDRGCLQKTYRPGAGGIIVYDDGDIQQELDAERKAYCELLEMPEITDTGEESESESEEETQTSHESRSRKRKSWLDQDNEPFSSDDEEENERPRQRRRSNSGSPISSSSPRSDHGNSSDVSRSGSAPPSSPKPSTRKPPSARALRKQLLEMRRSREAILHAYYASGMAYSEPISSLLYSLASELGREDNDILWLALVGVSSLEISGHLPSGLGILNENHIPHLSSWHTDRQARNLALFRDEVSRLNPPSASESNSPTLPTSIQTSAKSPTDTSIRLSPEPKFLLIRHWTLYESMLHSPYLASRLHLWNDNGIKRLHKLLAKMGVSLTQCKQKYTHIDVEVKRILRDRLLKYSSVYGLDGLVPPGDGRGIRGKEGWGFVRSWGWKACLSATDVGIITSSILEVGPSPSTPNSSSTSSSSELSSQLTAATTTADLSSTDDSSLLPRFFTAYDALHPGNPTSLLSSLPTAQNLLRAIHRTGTSLMSKHQIRHLRAFRMGIVRDGPDLALFSGSPGALVKLALWVGEAVSVREKENSVGGKGATPLVLGALNEGRGEYSVVGLGTGGLRGLGGEEDGEKKAEREKRRKEREAKRKIKEEKREARAKVREELGNGDGDGDAEQETEEEEEDETESEGEDGEDEERENVRKRGLGRNRFGMAFQEVIQETKARVRIDSFEHCVATVKREDLSGFLESLSGKCVVVR
ncbi:MAG: hypothetical protein Q9227_009388 [Pyrenula ochraceoflavens]